MISIENESDPRILRQVALLLENENNRLLTRNRQLAQEIARLTGQDPSTLQLEMDHLREILEQQRQELFGRSSEKRDAPVDDGAAEDAAQEAKPRKGHGPTPQTALPIVVAVSELAEAERSCHACGGVMVPMGGQFEESEEITVVERQFVRTVHQRQKYRCACNGCVVTAPAPERLIPGGRYSIDFAIEVIVGKYLDHLPLERQVRMMAREGLEVTSQALWDQLWAAAEHLRPSYEAIRAGIVREAILHADETHWPILDGRGREETNTRWWVWNLTSKTATYYEIHPSRSAEAAKKLIGDWRGIAVVDGYGAYAALARGAPGITLAHCWAHVRRKFIDIESSFPNQAREMLSLVGELYAIEREHTAAGCQGERLALLREARATRSRVVLRKILDWMGAQRALPRSGLGAAIAYVKGLWQGLTRFVDDPRIPLDNNAAERSLRGLVVGRKNHYGSKSRRGTEVAAIFYTLMETAKLRRVEPKAYLRAALHAAIRQPGTATVPAPAAAPAAETITAE